MTTQGERTSSPADHQHHAAPARSRGRRVTGGRVALWAVLAGTAVAVGWVVTRPNPGDLLPGLGPTSDKPAVGTPAPGVAPAQPMTEAQAFLAERYFPAQRGIDQDGYKGRRTGARQGSDCAEILQDRAHDPLHDAGCQGYLGVSFTRLDQQVQSSVTVLRFADDASALKAEEALREATPALLFVQPEGVAAPTAPPAGKPPLTTHRVAAVGHYLTVTVSRFADLRSTAPDTEHGLDDATRVLANVAGLPFIWM
ncbi:hypothetical protein OG871_33075 [Kitasatospora sp. NBC_00374]|uniref:hypothetical protein n=1 Tax=Kitasatospora sp. NBC_00374 TaxID=2975964 RepID=UPI0030E0F3BF